MKLYLLFIGFFFLGSRLTTHSAAEQEFRAGIQTLDKQDYAASIHTFEKLLKAGYKTSEVYNNLGTAYYMNGQLGKATVCYYRALRMAPDDKEVIENMNSVLKEINGAEAEVIVPSKGFALLIKSVIWLSADQWALLLIILSFGLSVIFITKLFLSSLFLKAKLQKIAYLFIFLLMLTALCVIVQDHYLNHKKQAIVIADSVSAKIAPSVNAKDSFNVKEGTRVEVLDNFQGWVKIRLPDRKTNWVMAQAIEMI